VLGVVGWGCASAPPPPTPQPPNPQSPIPNQIMKIFKSFLMFKLKNKIKLNAINLNVIKKK